MVYFMQAVDGGPIKIGHSADVERRREQLEAVYETRLEVLATMEGGRDEEQAIHARFSHLRIGRTEQFKPDVDLMAFLGMPLLVDANPDAVEAMPSKGQKIILVYKADERNLDAIKEWLEEISKEVKAPISVVLDMALNEFAKNRKLRAMPDRLR